MNSATTLETETQQVTPASSPGFYLPESDSSSSDCGMWCQDAADESDTIEELTAHASIAEYLDKLAYRFDNDVYDPDQCLKKGSLRLKQLARRLRSCETNKTL